MSSISEATYIQLYEANSIPLRVVLASLVWVLYEYLITLDEEVWYIWRQQHNLGRFMYFWVRYYTIFLLGFDTVQIHTFAIPGVATHALCVAADPATRIVGAVSLWSIEIIMQMRLYVLYDRSKKVLIFNAVLFLGSIGSFLWLVVVNAVRRGKLLRQIHTTSPLPGCPVINGGTEWAQWIPATAFEMVLFSFAIYRATKSIAARTRLNHRLSLTTILINENIFYFCVVSWVLIFNNLMVIGKTNIPWFGFGPFHAAVGIATCRMLMHLRKFASHELESQGNAYATTKATNAGGPMIFRGSEGEDSQGSTIPDS
ncbi:hypothetical protein HYPSUDRAFT_275893 [Hypholoma sublateritium FD-334 SS-4]|uniref:DUF6533 domain-containing protein n=1 Tax=Hypholoma sublateritium (strain FD-334 SS-4) TaxID=945553 RepID=A0A0D2MR69_HYPSF|nr:hypothetical protein HYPSUDRAFT_275893 [Hypholoma sublateritium FD-334 SS-4]